MSKKFKTFKTRCIVPNCNSGNSVKFNRFPKDTKQCQRWVQAVKNPFLETLSFEEVQTYRVCHLHFSKDSFFVTLERPRLKWDAVPSLRLPSKKTSSEELKIDLQNDKIEKNKNSILKPKLIEDSTSLSYNGCDNIFPENSVPIEQNISCEVGLFKEKNPVENILTYASKEFQRAEKGKEITIAFKIRANLYKHMNRKSLELRRLKSIKKVPFKENREIKTANCIVPNCKSARHITKHCFPKNKYIGKKWVKAIKSPYLTGMSYEEIRKKRFLVCYLHFPDDSWNSTALVKPRLKPDAVPSLFLPDKFIKTKKSIDLPMNQEEVPNIKMDLYFTSISMLSYNSMPNICDFSPRNACIRESSFKLRRNAENLNIKYRSINDVVGLPFETKYSKEFQILGI